MPPLPVQTPPDIGISVLDRAGVARSLSGSEGDNLMQLLRDHDLDVEATCGGSLSCATCHIYVHEPWAVHLPPPSEFESALLESLVHVSPRSRLACTLQLSRPLCGMSIAVAPAEA